MSRKHLSMDRDWCISDECVGRIIDEDDVELGIVGYDAAHDGLCHDCTRTFTQIVKVLIRFKKQGTMSVDRADLAFQMWDKSENLVAYALVIIGAVATFDITEARGFPISRILSQLLLANETVDLCSLIWMRDTDPDYYIAHPTHTAKLIDAHWMHSSSHPLVHSIVALCGITRRKLGEYHMATVASCWTEATKKHNEAFLQTLSQHAIGEKVKNAADAQ